MEDTICVPHSRKARCVNVDKSVMDLFLEERFPELLGETVEGINNPMRKSRRTILDTNDSSDKVNSSLMGYTFNSFFSGCDHKEILHRRQFISHKGGNIIMSMIVTAFILLWYLSSILRKDMKVCTRHLLASYCSSRTHRS